jgi:hypothetical protein
MLNDRRYQMLAELEDQSRAERTEDPSLWGLLQSLHAAPEVREFVSLESLALCPWVRRGEGGAEVHVLLAVPAAEDGRLAPPWGHLAWNWPARRLLVCEDVRARLAGVPSLGGECRCTREFADSVEQALRQGAEPPPLPQEMTPLVARLDASTETAAGASATQAEASSGGAAGAASGAGLMDLLEGARRLLRELGSAAFEQEWRRIYARLVASRFAVAVTGERARGKSTLINQLIGEDLLPISPAHPRVGTIEVTGSDVAALWVVTANGESQLPPTAVLGDVLATLPTDGVETGVRIESPNAWLAASGLRLIEVALEDAAVQTSVRALDALAGADSALIVMSATMAMSLSEKRLIEQYVLARKVPRVAVVLTRLESVRPAERDEVLAFVRRKVLAWGHQVEVHSVGGSSGTSAGGLQGIDELRSRLAAWSHDTDNRRLAQLQVTANLRELLGLVHAELLARGKAATLAESARQAQLEEARQELAARHLDWNELNLELERLHHQTRSWLEQKMQEQRRKLLDDLLYRLSNSGNPKLWWERELPYQLRAFESVAPAIEQALQQHIAADGNALIRAVERRFSRPLPFDPTGVMIGFERRQPAQATGEIDLTNLRWMVRTGSVAAMAISFWLVLNPIISSSSILLGEVLLHHTAEKQRQRLSEALPGLIDNLIDGALAGARKRLEEVYAGFGKALTAQEAAWSQAQESAAAAGSAPSDGGAAPLRRKLAEVEKIQKALAG